MAIHWLAKVPWAEIIANAPRIVEGAKTLSGYLRKPTTAPPPGTDPAAKKPPTIEQEVAGLKGKVAQLEAAQASSVQVLQSLANNSEQVAEALASLRAQAVLNFRLAVVCLVGVAVLAVLFFFKYSS
jgi:hypothetical protein